MVRRNRPAESVSAETQTTQEREPIQTEGAVTGRVSNLDAMTDAELLTEYNKRSPTKRRAKFKTREEALERIKALAPVSDPAQKPKREPKNVRARMAELKIVLVADANPYKEGNKSHGFFERMKGGVTVRQYLAKFEEGDQRVARQWLWNMVQKGHVKTVQASS